jgi:uncharacterized membrane protein YgaE (UPF0421/DUF939 family)
MTITARIRAESRIPLLQALKTSIASVVSWFVCLAILPNQLPIFAAIAALLVVQPSVNQSLGKAIERSAGVVVGVILAFGAGLLFGSASWLVIAAIVVAVLLGWALRLTPGSAAQIPISAMLVLSIGAQSPEYSAARIAETLIGAAIGVVVNLVVVPPVTLQPARLAVARLGRDTAAILEEIADAVQGRRSRDEVEALLVRARELRDERTRAAASVEKARESLMLNPRRARHRGTLESDEEMLGRLTVLTTRVVGMARALRDHYDSSISEETMARAIGTELRRAAHDLRLLVVDDPRRASDTAPVELPTLTEPIRVARPSEEHWVLIGALLEDLRRVREEIVGADSS